MKVGLAGVGALSCYLLALAHTGADRHQLGHARWKFLTWCADGDVPEVRRLAATIAG